ncbi:hypothetical protein [Phenylobacterium sp.]|uniref:hypothetical protein n=1 Tax=Phenylobacterium sp. TaxID=1871053 RepID=UPI00301C8244
MRRLIALVLLFAQTAAAQTAAAQTAGQALGEAEVRAFLTRQEAHWNAGRLDAYFAGFTPDATFTDQAYVGGKPPVPYGSSTRAEAQANARRAFARKPWPKEAGQVFSLRPAPDGGVLATTSVGSIVWADGRPRRLCASREQALVREAGELRARSRTDTFVRCRRG